MESRTRNSGLNIVYSLLVKLVTAISGLILPRIFIPTYGSEVNGLIASISQFLSYVTFLEMGIGGVMRASLYKPLAMRDVKSVSSIIKAAQIFYKKIGGISCIYIAGLCILYPILVKSSFGAGYIAVIILASSISLLLRYFISAPYSQLIDADQHIRICNLLDSLILVGNIIVVYILASFNADVRIVKLASALVFAVRPIILSIYVTRHYPLIKGVEPNSNAIRQRWNGAVHDFAFFVHKSTDIAVLTLFASLKAVSVYAVYNAIVSGVESIAVSFSNSCAASIGNMLVTENEKVVNERFNLIEFIQNSIIVILFTTSYLLIIPFISLYTEGMSDANYIQPLFGTILIVAEGIFCIGSLYGILYRAANKFKETQKGAIAESVINLTLSLALVSRFELVGVAIGTACAVAVRCIYNVIYLSKNVLNRPVKKFIRLISVDAGIAASSIMLCKLLFSYDIVGWGDWIVRGIVTFAVTLVVAIAFSMLFYRDELKQTWMLLMRVAKNRS